MSDSEIKSTALGFLRNNRHRMVSASELAAVCNTDLETLHVVMKFTNHENPAVLWNVSGQVRSYWIENEWAEECSQ